MPQKLQSYSYTGIFKELPKYLHSKMKFFNKNFFKALPIENPDFCRDVKFPKAVISANNSVQNFLLYNLRKKSTVLCMGQTYFRKTIK